MGSNEVDQAIQRLSEAASSLTLDQRLRIAALLAKPAVAAQNNPLQDAASSQATLDALLLTVEEAAELLKIGRTTVYDLMKTGQLNSTMIGRLRRLRYIDLPHTSTRSARTAHAEAPPLPPRSIPDQLTRTEAAPPIGRHMTCLNYAAMIVSLLRRSSATPRSA
ncbi:helix-turn-helix domain-containing protein [Actinoplanes couchii]|uniref:helix-turn-helix domain-containing protein n=1 Tax=Actinoplanes couchii TaxID=403638 RepID=UPI001EF1D8F2|nr:helix-turn-helix domain-containing protein [Actinoplanes couchii]MDR6320049.1 excisionase family DNA binding protein [Actinoplanes couchii]